MSLSSDFKKNKIQKLLDRSQQKIVAKNRLASTLSSGGEFFPPVLPQIQEPVRSQSERPTFNQPLSARETRPRQSFEIPRRHSDASDSTLDRGFFASSVSNAAQSLSERSPELTASPLNTLVLSLDNPVPQPTSQQVGQSRWRRAVRRALDWQRQEQVAVQPQPLPKGDMSKQTEPEASKEVRAEATARKAIALVKQGAPAPQIETAVERFAQRLVDEFGSLAKSFEEFDSHGRNEITRSQWDATLNAAHWNTEELGVTSSKLFSLVCRASKKPVGAITLQAWNSFFKKYLARSAAAHLLTADNTEKLLAAAKETAHQLKQGKHDARSHEEDGKASDTTRSDRRYGFLSGQDAAQSGQKTDATSPTARPVDVQAEENRELARRNALVPEVAEDSSHGHASADASADPSARRKNVLQLRDPLGQATSQAGAGSAKDDWQGAQDGTNGDSTIGTNAGPGGEGTRASAGQSGSPHGTAEANSSSMDDASRRGGHSLERSVVDDGSGASGSERIGADAGVYADKRVAPVVGAIGGADTTASTASTGAGMGSKSSVGASGAGIADLAHPGLTHGEAKGGRSSSRGGDGGSSAREGLSYRQGNGGSHDGGNRASATMSGSESALSRSASANKIVPGFLRGGQSSPRPTSKDAAMLAFNSRDHIEALSQHSQDAQDLHDADEGADKDPKGDGVDRGGENEDRNAINAMASSNGAWRHGQADQDDVLESEDDEEEALEDGHGAKDFQSVVKKVFKHYASGRSKGRDVFIRNPDLGHFVEDAKEALPGFRKKFRRFRRIFESLFDDTIQLQCDMPGEGVRITAGLTLDWFQVFVQKAVRRLGAEVMSFFMALLEAQGG
ncbi:unnamed protein product [Effrenium voratum]|nr:unnamed protein product [Effrenium voratum]